MFESIKLKNRNFLSSSDLTRDEILSILKLATDLKNKKIDVKLNDKVLGLIFDKSSTRTRVSFQVAMSRLGGTTIDLNPQTSQIGRGEPIKDTARVLSTYCDVLAIRTFCQTNIQEYAKWSTIPIINALTDIEHPCQALADYLTIQETFGSFNGLVLTFIGDGNNVANSLILCGSLLGIEIRIACPKNFEPNPVILEIAKKISNNQNTITISNDPFSVIDGSNILYTDVWSSMGEEAEKEQKEKVFEGFKIDKNLLNKAEDNAIVLHCLPAYRGKEITDDVIESKNSKIFEQAENRMHVQQALLYLLLG